MERRQDKPPRHARIRGLHRRRRGRPARQRRRGHGDRRRRRRADRDRQAVAPPAGGRQAVHRVRESDGQGACQLRQCSRRPARQAARQLRAGGGADRRRRGILRRRGPAARHGTHPHGRPGVAGHGSRRPGGHHRGIPAGRDRRRGRRQRRTHGEVPRRGDPERRRGAHRTRRVAARQPGGSRAGRIGYPELRRGVPARRARGGGAGAGGRGRRTVGVRVQDQPGPVLRQAVMDQGDERPDHARHRAGGHARRPQGTHHQAVYPVWLAPGRQRRPGRRRPRRVHQADQRRDRRHPCPAERPVLSAARPAATGARGHPGGTIQERRGQARSVPVAGRGGRSHVQGSLQRRDPRDRGVDHGRIAACHRPGTAEERRQGGGRDERAACRLSRNHCAAVRRRVSAQEADRWPRPVRQGGNQGQAAAAGREILIR